MIYLGIEKMLEAWKIRGLDTYLEGVDVGICIDIEGAGVGICIDVEGADVGALIKKLSTL